jgi:flagellar motor switch/type III secretory pathway protein FliN
MFSSLISSSSSEPGGPRPGAGITPAVGPLPNASAAAAASAPAVAPGPAASNPDLNGDPFALFRDVVCPVEVLLGTGSLSLRQCLGLERGSVVRLQQSAGEDLVVSVRGVSIGLAEVVIIDETIAVRVTHLAGPIGRERRA